MALGDVRQIHADLGRLPGALAAVGLASSLWAQLRTELRLIGVVVPEEHVLGVTGPHPAVHAEDSEVAAGAPEARDEVVAARGLGAPARSPSSPMRSSNSSA